MGWKEPGRTSGPEGRGAPGPRGQQDTPRPPRMDRSSSDCRGPGLGEPEGTGVPLPGAGLRVPPSPGRGRGLEKPAWPMATGDSSEGPPGAPDPWPPGLPSPPVHCSSQMAVKPSPPGRVGSSLCPCMLQGTRHSLLEAAFTRRAPRTEPRPGTSSQGHRKGRASPVQTGVQGGLCLTCSASLRASVFCPVPKTTGV